MKLILFRIIYIESQYFYDINHFMIIKFKKFVYFTKMNKGNPIKKKNNSRLFRNKQFHKNYIKKTRLVKINLNQSIFNLPSRKTHPLISPNLPRFSFSLQKFHFYKRIPFPVKTSSIEPIAIRVFPLSPRTAATTGNCETRMRSWETVTFER